jgi:DNA-binding response OmpR family regulator
MRRSKSASLDGVRVLIVEDDPGDANRIFVSLMDAGCNVRIACNALEALAITALFDPGLMVINLVLPGHSGLVLAAHLQKEAATRATVLIATTSLNGEAERIALEAGFVACLQKPVDLRALRALLLAHAGPSRGGGHR